MSSGSTSTEFSRARGCLWELKMEIWNLYKIKEWICGWYDNFMSSYFSTVYIYGSVDIYVLTKGLRKQNRRWSIWLFFPFYCVLRNGFETFKIQLLGGLFEIWKALNPPKGLQKQNWRWSIWCSFHFIVFEKRFWHFQSPNFQVAFLKSWKCFIPRRDCESRTECGPFDILSILLCLRNGFDIFKIPSFFLNEHSYSL